MNTIMTRRAYTFGSAVAFTAKDYTLLASLDQLRVGGGYQLATARPSPKMPFPNTLAVKSID